MALLDIPARRCDEEGGEVGMTNQRAIVLLSQMYIPAFDEEEKDAITKAIEALTAQEPRLLTLDEIHDSMVV